MIYVAAFAIDVHGIFTVHLISEKLFHYVH